MRSVNLENNGKIFTVINSAGKNAPVVVMFHGFTGNHIEAHFIFARLSKALEKNGISSVRFDFRGSGNSSGTFEEMTLSSESSDAYSVINYVKSHFNSRLGVLGLSMGGTVALLTVEKVKPDALCLWAPAAKNREVFSPGIPAIPGDLEFFDVGGIRVSKQFAKEVLSFDAFGNAKKYRGPALIIHGTSDQSVPFPHSQDLVKEFKSGKLIPVEGSDHVFSSFEWSEKAISETVKFFSEKLK
jgi:alpha/beta superfamily hydrolase|uniref:Alpha/beta hydrolase n=1 Tax=Mesoaciditoga lauensis TaxID=1495039 RepID=A0A7V3REX5_9BACT